MSNPKCDYDVFLSYDQEWNTKESVEKFHDKLHSDGYKVWCDTNLQANQNAIRQISNSILNSQIFLCLLTRNYCDSNMSNREIDYAFKCGKTIVYLMIENMTVEEMGSIGFMMGHIVAIECFKNMYSWWEDDFSKIKSTLDNNLNVYQANTFKCAFLYIVIIINF